ncbi:MAG: hypothetical protein FGM24_00860 [Candidatus Kapabacteria bacterium]|nr:hypothetical protein [Candidatus Kapabacteria bacterium]
MHRCSLVLRIVIGCMLLACTIPTYAQAVDTSFAQVFRDQCEDEYRRTPTQMFALPDGTTLHIFRGEIAEPALRILPDGSIDNSWGATDELGWRSAMAAAWYSDSSLVILYRPNGGNAWYVARVFVDGTIDPTFSSIQFGIGDYYKGEPTCIAVDNEGRVVVAGCFRDARTNGTTWVGAMRLTAEGAIDTTFTPPAVKNYYVTGITMLADGEMLLRGSFTGLGGIPVSKLAKVRENGSVDTSFIPAIDSAHVVVDVRVVSGGELLVATNQAVNSSSDYLSTLVLINADGTARADAPVWDVSQSIIRGIMPLGGNSYLAYGSRRVRRYPDPVVWYATMVVGERAVLDQTVGEPSYGQVSTALRLRDGSIVLSGTFQFIGRTRRHGHAKLNPDYTLDDAYAAMCGNAGTYGSVTVRDDGSVVAGGLISSIDNATYGPVVIMTSDGALSSVQDRYQLPAYWLGRVRADVQGHDSLGRVYVLRYYPSNSTDTGGLVRLFSDGFVDTTFRIPKSLAAAVHRARPLPDGRVYISGHFTSVGDVEQKYLARLLSDGSLDTTFRLGLGINAYSKSPADYPVAPIKAMELTANADLIIAGRISGYDGVQVYDVVRLKPNGSRDERFNSIMFLRGTSGTDITDVVTFADGSVIIAGQFSEVCEVINGRYKSVVNTSITRLLRSGRVDPSYAPYLTRYGNRFLGANNGDLYVSRGTAIMRVRSDGSVDKDTLVTTNRGISAMAWQGSRDIVLVGEFTRVGSTNVSNIARVRIVSTTGVGDIDDAAASLVPFPNPVEDVLKIDVSPEDYGLAVDVVNMNGIPVWRDTVEISPVMVPFTQLPPGLYAIRVGRRTALVVHR